MNLTPLGDRALLIHLGDTIDEATHRRVRAVWARLTTRPIPGTIEVVPAFASVAVHYDPARVPNEQGGRSEASPYDRFAAAVAGALGDLGEESLPVSRSVEGALYSRNSALEVAERHGLSPDEVVRLHSSATYRVYMLGFAPGFAYLGGLPDVIATPRRPEPRTSVPAGSVGIGGSQTGIYPLVLPGGWQLIGRTPLRLFDARQSSPTVLAVGDVVTFRPIAPNDFTHLATPA